MSHKGGETLELCTARWWASLGECAIKRSVTFHGVTPSEKSITLVSTSFWVWINLFALVCTADVVLLENNSMWTIFVLLQQTSKVCRVDVKPALREEEILPTVSLKTHAQPVRYLVRLLLLLLTFQWHVNGLFNKLVTSDYHSTAQLLTLFLLSLFPGLQNTRLVRSVQGMYCQMDGKSTPWLSHTTSIR